MRRKIDAGLLVPEYSWLKNIQVMDMNNENSKLDAERVAFEAAYAEAVDSGWTSTKALAQMIWQKARASHPAGVPDGGWVEPVALTSCSPDYDAGWRDGISEAKRLNAPAVQAEQPECGCCGRSDRCDDDCDTRQAPSQPTPEFVWIRLMEALAGDNGCAFTASTDDYREAKAALVELIAAGFFRDEVDSLDGDIWMVAAGEQGEAAARFARCAGAYAVLSGVLNRVFARPEDFPSLPAVESWRDQVQREFPNSEPEYWPDSITIPAMGREIRELRAALSAQLSAPERVSVPVELAERIAKPVLLERHKDAHADACAELRTLLASHGRGEA